MLTMYYPHFAIVCGSASIVIMRECDEAGVYPRDRCKGAGMSG